MLFLLFIIWPITELTLLIKVGGHIGTGNMLLIILGTGVLGAYLAKIQGLLVVQKMQNSLNEGCTPNEALLEGFLIFLGGVFLILPGLITDCLGMILLIPPARWVIRKIFEGKIKDMVKNGQIITAKGFERRQGYYDVDAKVHDIERLPPEKEAK